MRPAVRERKLGLWPKQIDVWNSSARTILCLKGWRAGGTFVGPPWLLREIKLRGPGEYLVGGPTFALLEQGAIPAIKQLFEYDLRLGWVMGGQRPVFRFDESRMKHFYGYEPQRKTLIRFGYAKNPDSLEGATYLAAWLDEWLQKCVTEDAQDVVESRLSIDEGRMLITSRPYYIGWAKRRIYDEWKRGNQRYDVVRMQSKDNKYFKKAEWDHAKRTLPRWKFNLKYRALFDKPAGLIYNCFDETKHKEPAFAPTTSHRRYLGVDFGGVNTAAVKLAEDPTNGVIYVYGEYHAGDRTAKQHADAMLTGESVRPYKSFGGSKSEGQWRGEFRAAGLPLQEPDISDVEVGIQRVWGLINTGMLMICDNCTRLLDEIGSYSRVLDDDGEPTEKIEDKDDYHLLDALRYICSWIYRSRELRGLTLTTEARDERRADDRPNPFLT